MATSTKHEHEELIACAEREVKMRRRVFPSRVARKTMSQEFADLEISRMEAIAQFLRDHAPAPVPPPQGKLF